MATAARYHLPPLPTIKEIIQLYKLRAQKHLSQNFLLDMNLTNKIVKSAGKTKDCHVVEVGPGPGGITRAIIQRNIKHLSVVELDKRFLPGLQLLKENSLNEQMTIHHADILRFNMDNVFDESLHNEWHEYPPNIHIIGNLPFNVSTPLIMKWMELISSRSGPWKCGRVRLTLTFQKEVAERMVAPVLDKQRSRLSIMCQHLCQVKHKFTIPGSCFVPAPDVDVAVVHFVPLEKPLIEVPFPFVEKLVRNVFHYRQKKCKYGLQKLFPPDQPDLSIRLIKEADIDPDTRPRALTMEEFERLCHTYHNICEQHTDMFEYDYRSKKNAPQWRKSVPSLSF